MFFSSKLNKFKNLKHCFFSRKNGISNGKTGSDIERILAFDNIGKIDPIKYKNMGIKITTIIRLIKSSQ